MNVAKVMLNDLNDCLKKAVAAYFWSLHYAASLDINQHWEEVNLFQRGRPPPKLKRFGNRRGDTCPHSKWRQGSVPFPVT